MCFYLSLLAVTSIVFLPLKPIEAECSNGLNYRSVLIHFARSARLVCQSKNGIFSYVEKSVQYTCCAFDLTACENAKRGYKYYETRTNINSYFRCYYAFYSMYFEICDCPSKLKKKTPTKPPVNYELCGLSGWNQLRIYNGQKAEQCEFPWMAFLNLGLLERCGGVLIDNEHVITAVHCIKYFRKNDNIFLGSNDLKHPVLKLGVKKIIEHPQYRFDDDGYYHDIAILTLSTKVRFTECLKPICLPDMIYEVTNITNCVVAGWGMNEFGRITDYLYNVKVPIVSEDLCRSQIQNYEPGLLCAGYVEGGKDSCHGDSGGPLMCPDKGRWVLAGIVSFGLFCGKPNQPGVYTDVKYHIDWILNNLS